MSTSISYMSPITREVETSYIIFVNMKHLLQCLLLLAQVPSTAQDRVVGYVTSFDGVQITYDIHGNTPTLSATGMAVVLVHGWSCDRTYWMKQAEALSK